MIKKFQNHFKTFYFSVAAITILAVAVLAFMLFWGNGLFRPNPAATKIYFADNISPTHQLLIDMFNEKHKGRIEVVPINLPFEKFSTNERKELLIRYLRSKSDRIDIFSVDHIWVPRFAKWTEPLNRYITQPQRERILELVLQTCYYKGDLVALPSYFDLGMLYVNTDFLKTQPAYESIKKELDNFITWERFIEISKKMNLRGKPYYLFPADDYEGLMCSFVELLEQQNSKMFDGDTVKITTPQAEKALQLLVDLVNKHNLAPKSVLDSRESECYHTYINENGVFLRGWSGLDDWYRINIAPVDVLTKYSAVPLPYFKDGKPASIIGGWNMMLSKYSSNKSEAVEFIRFMISDEAQQIMFDKGGYLPVNKNFYSNTKLNDSFNEITFLKKIISTGVHRPFLDKYTRCSDVIAHYLNLALKNKISPKESLAAAERVINGGEFFIK
ncbi:MAG: extracellular solute-binding protein family 1 [Ignavibacteria bacterium]|nr:MAG: extracellular solute-binding protein family 1 [Ignavibacteria bacterium]KAF0157182.1 MAG: extracellular solute-binding protein family 1 [Ignavibacteria bacterium]